MWWTNPSKRWEIVSKCMDSTKPAESAGLAAMYVHGVGRDVMKHLASMPGIKPGHVLPSLSHIDFSDLAVEFGKAIGNDAAAEAIVGWHWDAARGADDVAKRLCAHGVSVPVALARAGDIYGVPPEQDSQFVAVAKAATNEEQVRRAGLTFVTRWAAGKADDGVIAKAVADRFMRDGEYVDVRRNESGQFAPKPKTAAQGLFAQDVKEEASSGGLFGEAAAEPQVAEGVFAGDPVNPVDVEGRKRLRKKRKKQKEQNLKLFADAVKRQREKQKLEAELKAEQEAFDGDVTVETALPPWETDAQTKKRRMERFKRFKAMNSMKAKYEKFKRTYLERQTDRKKMVARLNAYLEEAKQNELARMSPGEKLALNSGYFLTDEDDETTKYDYAIYATGWQPNPNFSGGWTEDELNEYVYGTQDTAHWAWLEGQLNNTALIGQSPRKNNVFPDEPFPAWKLSIPLWVAIPALEQNWLRSGSDERVRLNMGRVNSALIEAGDEPVAVERLSEADYQVTNDDPRYADSLAPLTYKGGQWYLNMYVPPYSREWTRPMALNQDMQDLSAPMRSFQVNNTSQSRDSPVQAIAPSMVIDATGANRFVSALKDSFDDAYFERTYNTEAGGAPKQVLNDLAKSIDMDGFQARIDPDRSKIGSQRDGVRGRWESVKNDINNAIEDGWVALNSGAERVHSWDAFRSAVQNQEWLKVQKWMKNTWAEEFYQLYMADLAAKHAEQQMTAEAMGHENAEYFGPGIAPLQWFVEKPGSKELEPFTLNTLFAAIRSGRNPFMQAGLEPEEVRDIYLQRAANMVTFRDDYEMHAPAVVQAFDEQHQQVVPMNSDYEQFKRLRLKNSDPFAKGKHAEIGDTIVGSSNGNWEHVWVWEYPTENVMAAYEKGGIGSLGDPEWVDYGAPTSESMEIFDTLREMINGLYGAVEDENIHAQMVGHDTRVEMSKAEQNFRGALMDKFAHFWDPQTFPKDRPIDPKAWDDQLDRFVLDLVSMEPDGAEWIAASVQHGSKLRGQSSAPGDLMFEFHSSAAKMRDNKPPFRREISDGAVFFGDDEQERNAASHIPTLQQSIAANESLLRRDFDRSEDGYVSETPMPLVPGGASALMNAYQVPDDDRGTGWAFDVEFEKYAGLVGLMNSTLAI